MAMRTNPIAVKRAKDIIERMTGECLHAKRLGSLTNAVVGVVNAVSLSIHAIGAGLADATGLNTKHAIKQVDRLLLRDPLISWARLAVEIRK